MFYFRLDAVLIEKLDRRIHRLGYASRAEFFTAVSYAVLLGTLADETTNQTSTIQGQSGLSQHLPTLPDSLKIWMEKSVPKISEEQILSDQEISTARVILMLQNTFIRCCVVYAYSIFILSALHPILPSKKKNSCRVICEEFLRPFASCLFDNNSEEVMGLQFL